MFCVCVWILLWWNFLHESSFSLPLPHPRWWKLSFVFPAEKRLWVTVAVVLLIGERVDCMLMNLSQQGWWLLFKLNCIPLDSTVKLCPLLLQIQILCSPYLKRTGQKVSVSLIVVQRDSFTPPWILSVTLTSHVSDMQHAKATQELVMQEVNCCEFA